MVRGQIWFQIHPDRLRSWRPDPWGALCRISNYWWFV